MNKEHQQQRRLSAVGALVLMLAVIAGAFGAHGLRSTLSPYSMQIYEKAVFYQFVHGIGLLVLPMFKIAREQLVFVLFFIGTVIFSGSLYALSISGVGILGAITPVGGISFIIGWFIFALQLWRK